ncbi:MAG: hypothetical protein DRJ60_00075 [Thermoprotei archaeon]|nr:MAG: hypothetical protein DRJ60_00075 [Thermoprotei archaeon]
MLVRFVEDLAIFNSWVREVIEIHFSPSWSYYPLVISTHVVTPFNHECDFVISSKKKNVSVLCELKDWTVEDTLNQVLERRSYFDFAYAVINLPTYHIFNGLRKLGKEKLNEVLSKGIGIISSKDNLVLIRSYRVKKHSVKLMPIVEEIIKKNADKREKQTDKLLKLLLENQQKKERDE